MDRDLLFSLHNKVHSEIVSCCERLNELKALEELILLYLPKAPLFLDVPLVDDVHIDRSSLKSGYTCPSCGSSIFKLFGVDSFCRSCGQAIDWGD